MLLLLSADIFQNLLFKKILSGTLPECQTVQIQIRTDNMSVLISIQTVCKSYQQMTLVGKELNMFNLFSLHSNVCVCVYVCMYVYMSACQTYVPDVCATVCLYCCYAKTSI